MSEWVRLTPYELPGLRLFHKQMGRGHLLAEGNHANDLTSKPIRVTEDEALVFAALLPEVRALAVAASGIAVPFYGMLLKKFGSPDSWPSDRAGIVRYEALKAALAPFEAADG